MGYLAKVIKSTEGMSVPTDLITPQPLGVAVVSASYPNPTQYFLDNPYKKTDIEERRAFIYSVISEKLDGKVNRVDCFRNSDLMIAFLLYDKLFFQSAFKWLIEVGKIKFNITFEEEVISEKTGEGVVANGGGNRLRVSRKFFRDLFRKESKFKNSTFVCYDRLECILNTFEHEMVHVYQSFYDIGGFNDPTNNFHGPRFVRLNKNIFGIPFTTASDTFDDVAITPERIEKIAKTLKKGQRVQYRNKGGNPIDLIVEEEPITTEDPFHKVKVKYPGHEGVFDVSLAGFKSPPSVLPTANKEYLRPSPISKKEPPKEFITEENKRRLKEKEEWDRLRAGGGNITDNSKKYPPRLSWNEFRKVARQKYGITNPKAVSEEYKKYYRGQI